MYVRTKVFKNKDGSTRTYLELIESYRVNGRARQRVIANLGRVEELQKGQIDRLIQQLTKFTETKWIKAHLEDSANIVWTKSWGPALVFRHLWEKLGLKSVLKSIPNSSEVTPAAIFAMVLNRLCDPQSKLGVSEWVNTMYCPEFESLQLQHYYRVLDILAEHKDKIELHLFHRVRDLFNLGLDLVFWDTTSTYFEGKGPEEFAKFGYSKDKCSDRMQIVIGVLMTKEGIPVAHEVFPCNTCDINTFKSILNCLREKFQINRVIIVGDRGMVSQKVLAEINNAGMEYIVGMRMRRLKGIDHMLSWNA